MDAVPGVDDDRGLRQPGSRYLRQGIFYSRMIDVGPQAADGTDLPSQVELSFAAHARTDAEVQIRTILFGLTDEPSNVRQNEDRMGFEIGRRGFPVLLTVPFRP